MPILSRMIFGFVNLRARSGLAESSPQDSAKLAARRTGVRGETFAYWYLRRRGYIIVARNFMVPGIKGEIDLAGYDGTVLAFIEVKTRTLPPDEGAANSLPEDAVTPAKKHRLGIVARQFLSEWRIRDTPYRFDVLAIESRPGQSPTVRLHKDFFAMSSGRGARR